MSSNEKRTRRSRNKLGRGLSALVDTQGGLGASARPIAPVGIDLHTAQGDLSPEKRVFEILLGDLYPNSSQPRNDFQEEALESLANSIRETGLMQPIVVRARAAGGFEIIAGERRWRASRLAGLETIPAILRDVDDQQSAQWALIENIQREDLNPIEKGNGYKKLGEQFGLTQQEIATRVGVSRAGVANMMRLLDLDTDIQMMVTKGQLSAGHAKALLQCADLNQRSTLATRAVEQGWSVRVLEKAAGTSVMGNVAPADQPKEPRDSRIETVLADLEQQLGEYLGTKVALRTDKGGTKGRLVIQFYDLDHFDGLMSRIGFASKDS
ncbi:MAG: ParB/RepB/Spo0J family partition protein [Phycisphaerales bacterium]|nr:ParB/RepB/Spo0J family partition protein [Phycisphaerales bacterium]